jgi:hypothetical protein
MRSRRGWGRTVVWIVGMVGIGTSAAGAALAQPLFEARLPTPRLEARAAGPGEAIASPDGSPAERITLESRLAPTLLRLGPEEAARVADWPVAPGRRETVVLARHEVYAPGARIVAVDGRRERELPRSRMAFYWGVGESDPELRVFASIDPESGRLEGFAHGRDGIHELRADGPRHHRVARSESFLPAAATAAGAPAWSCGEESLPWSLALPFAATAPDAVLGAPGAAPAQAAAALAGLATATVAFDTDNELMSAKFSNDTTAATNYLASLVAAIDVMYERDLSIRLVQGTTFLRVSTTADPYAQSGTGAADGNKLNEFSTYWGANYGSVQRAVAAMISGKQGSSNSASGIAWVGGLCSTSYGYSFSQVFKISYLAGDALVVGHEIGHNFGSPHTHCYSPPIDTCYNAEAGCYSGPTSCPAPTTINGVANVGGTVMSYCQFAGCNPSLVFHPRTVALVSPNIASAMNVCIFPVSNAPTVTAVNPKGGATAGGTPVTVTGTNFQAGATVSLGGVAATSVSVLSSTTLTAVTGAHAGGLVSAAVANGTASSSLSNAFFYNPPVPAAAFYTLPPCRLLDTRNPNGALGGPPLGGGLSRTFAVAGVCGIPSGAKSLSINLTVTGTSSAGYLALYPGNAIPFGTSAISFKAGETRANDAMVLLATDGTGTLGIKNAGTGALHVIVDVDGYFQ